MCEGLDCDVGVRTRGPKLVSIFSRARDFSWVCPNSDTSEAAMWPNPHCDYFGEDLLGQWACSDQWSSSDQWSCSGWSSSDQWSSSNQWAMRPWLGAGYHGGSAAMYLSSRKVRKLEDQFKELWRMKEELEPVAVKLLKGSAQICGAERCGLCD